MKDVEKYFGSGDWILLARLKCPIGVSSRWGDPRLSTTEGVVGWGGSLEVGAFGKAYSGSE